MATCPSCRTRYPDEISICTNDGMALLPDEAFTSADQDLVAGQMVGEYRVEAKIGEGGFGSVYRAVHPLIGKAAAVKVLNRQYSSNPQMVSRFIAEARAVNQIRNRNIIDIFSFGKIDDGRQYYVMELLDGSTFDAYLRQKRRLTVEEAMPILKGIARALDAAHAAGIAHRDLKPENIFLVFEDDGLVFPKLLDFGIAKLLGESMSGHKTRTGAPMGTPHYMSPEQCRGKNVDHRTDIYSFGIMIHLALTGQLPFDGDEVMDLLVAHTSKPAPRMSEVCPDIPATLDAPVLQMLEKDPALRPVSLVAALDALALAAQGAGYAVAPSGQRAAGGPSRTGDGDARAAGPTKPSATPAQAALAEARTVMQDDPSNKTLGPSATDVGSARGGRKLVLAGVALVVVGALAAVAVIGLREKAPTGPALATQPPASAASEVKTAAAVEVKPAPTVTPSATAEAQSPEVELTIDATPKVVEVFQGTTPLGTSDKPVRVKRADGKVKLTFKAKGYVSRDIEVSSAANGTVSVTLAKAGKQGGNGNKSEIEF